MKVVNQTIKPFNFKDKHNYNGQFESVLELHRK